MSAAASALSFDTTFGSLYIGSSVSCLIFGLITTQVIIYYRKYPLDRWQYQYLVACLWMLELASQVFIGHAVYFYTITNFGNPLVLFNNPIIWSLVVQLMVGAVCGTLVRICLALRVWRFSQHNVPVATVIGVPIVVECALAIWLTIESFKLSALADFTRLKTIMSVLLGLGVLIDSTIAFALCYFMRLHRTVSDISDSLVKKLMMYAIGTSALTCSMTICTIILLNVFPNALYFLSSYFVLVKLYAGSLLATLNTRKPKNSNRSKTLSRPGNNLIRTSPNSSSPDIYQPLQTKEHGYDIEHGSSVSSASTS